MLMTHRRRSDVLHDEDCTFTIAQSPFAFDFRQVGAEPLKPWVRADGPKPTRSASLSAVCAVTMPRCHRSASSLPRKDQARKSVLRRAGGERSRQRYAASMHDRAHAYGGMTVNERLVMSGLIAKWDRAVDRGDRATAIDVLRQVGLETQAAEIVETAFARRSE
ncbi:MAG: hypothetical protein K0R99_4427 [Microbacterium sp.]|nr:hypothetical protein [Microbacterium sp.]